MANIQSQIKRNRQMLKRRGRNKAVKSELKTYMKRFHAAADAGERDEAQQAFADASQKLDKAAGKGVVHANYAANKKSRMATRLHAI